MAFSTFVEILNILARRARERRVLAHESHQHSQK
jgi:hypothetical protein